MIIERHELEPILANVVRAGDFILTAGCIADDTSLDVEGQTRQALADLDRYLARCGSDKTHILFAKIWVSDIRLRDAMNKAWIAWADPAHLPARACTEARMAEARCLVEIQVVATRRGA